MLVQYICHQCGIPFRGQASKKRVACSSRCLSGRPRLTVDDFWRQVEKTESCWIWTGPKFRGYGRARLNGRPILAHRLSWELEYGAIPEGLEVCHDCPDRDNPSCVNPDHLFLGTHTDNMRDAGKKGRMGNARGERHHEAKLTAEDVCQIRRRRDKGETLASIARDFGISDVNVSYIAQRKSWRHIP
jgi:hypothetical protein